MLRAGRAGLFLGAPAGTHLLLTRTGWSTRDELGAGVLAVPPWPPEPERTRVGPLRGLAGPESGPSCVPGRLRGSPHLPWAGPGRGAAPGTLCHLAGPWRPRPRAGQQAPEPHGRCARPCSLLAGWSHRDGRSPPAKPRVGSALPKSLRWQFPGGCNWLPLAGSLPLVGQCKARPTSAPWGPGLQGGRASERSGRAGPLRLPSALRPSPARPPAEPAAASPGSRRLASRHCQLAPGAS